MKVVRWVMLLAAVVALAGTFYMFWQVRRHPLEISERIGRDELARQGLVRGLVAGPHGPLVTWTRPGRGPSVVLVHGEDDSAAGWAPLVGRLPRDRALVVPDLPGHGESAPESGPLTLEDLAAGLESVLADRPAGEPYVLVAHSLGAVVAWQVAARRRDDPPRLLVLVAPFVLEPGDPAFAMLLPRDEQAALELLRLEQREKAPPIPDYLPPARVRRAAGGPLARLQADLAKRLPYRWPPSATTDTLVVEPGQDQLMPSPRVRELAGSLPAEVVQLAACGHIPQRECPEALAALLVERLDALSAAGPASRPGDRRGGPGARDPAR